MYNYRECGLPNVWLVNGYIREDTPYGPATAIENLRGLHAAIADSLLEKGALTGDEFRFLRKELGLSQSGLGALLGVSDQQVARYEKDQPTPMADRMLRILYQDNVSGHVRARQLIEILSQLDRDAHEQELRFEETEQGWAARQAA